MYRLVYWRMTPGSTPRLSALSPDRNVFAKYLCHHKYSRWESKQNILHLLNCTLFISLCNLCCLEILPIDWFVYRLLFLLVAKGNISFVDIYRLSAPPNEIDEQLMQISQHVNAYLINKADSARFLCLMIETLGSQKHSTKQRGGGFIGEM